jgi:stage II sporulation protein D
MKKILFLAFLFPLLLHAQRMNVRVLSTMKVSAVNVSVQRGNYRLQLDGVTQHDTLLTKVFQVLLVGDSLEVRIPGDTLGRFALFTLQALRDSSSYRIKPITPVSGTRTYDADLKISVSAGQLFCTNNVMLESYVGGVVESESGGRSLLEFYKVQAIICRTYALAHINRHFADGFDVCDGVHCQVYRSKTVDPVISKATLETAGQVIVDKNLNLITAAFHSNCGGETANSGDVWAANLSYLKAVDDTFCTRMPNAHWSRKIARTDWLNYLETKHKYPVNDSIARGKALHMTQDNRDKEYVHGAVRIPYKTIRSDWQLKSAYFSIAEQKDSIIISGRGYGHGVGLCQEGAIRMAQLGYTSEFIIKHYYQDVEIVHLSHLDFFREE